MAEYVISTVKGCVPHVVDLEKPHFMDRSFVIYADDFIYPGSYYLLPGKKMNLKDFLRLPGKIILMFKQGTKPTRKANNRVLKTPGGEYKLNLDVYNQFIAVGKPDIFASFETNDVGFEIKFPESVGDFIEGLKSNTVSSGFVNELTDQGKVVANGSAVPVEDYDFGCDCCSMHKPEYFKYLWKLKEINAFMLIQNHNLKTLHKLAAESK